MSNYNKLIFQLQSSGLITKNPPLYQVLVAIIKALNSIDSSSNNGSSSGGGTTIVNQTFISPPGVDGDSGEDGDIGPPGVDGIDGANGMIPYFIAPDEIFTIPLYKQALFSINIDNEGILEVDGFLTEVDGSNDSDIITTAILMPILDLDSEYDDFPIGPIASTIPKQAGGSDGQVQYNNNGLLDGDSDMTFNTDTLSVTKLIGQTSIKTPNIISGSDLTIQPLPGSNLNLSLSGAGDLAVNNNQLYVDTSVKSIGIGTTTPNFGGSGTALSLADAATNRIEGKRTTASSGVSSIIVLDGYNGNTRVVQFNIRADGATDAGAFEVYTKPTGGVLARCMLVNNNRVIVDNRFQMGGTSLLTSDWAITSGWGANAAISAVTGTDTRGTVTVQTSALDTPTANPTITLTFKNGTWTAIPFVVADLNLSGTGLVGSVRSRCTTTTLVLEYSGTPTPLTAATYIFNYIVIG